ncbi:MAG TPA: hypothetical protein VM913_00625 [Sphingomicrobium sp.]|nr:hypothetical protein [Sphingomicrobium sp.]
MPRLMDWSRVTEEEYRANLTGMNTFFGAVIGFVLADVTTSDLAGFAQLLVLTAAIVIGILYISASPRRWLYGAFNLLFIYALPVVLDEGAGNAGRLQITLATWTLMTIGVEALWAWQNRRDIKRRASAP